MATPRLLSPERIQELKRDRSRCTTRALAEKYGISETSVRNYLKRAGGSPVRESQNTSKSHPKETVEYVGHKCNVTLNQTRIHTEEELIEYFQMDMSVWEIERFKANKWEVGMKPVATTEWVTNKRGTKIPMWTREDDKPIVVPLYQVMATFIKKKNAIAARNEIQELKQLAQKYPFPKSRPKHRPAKSDNMLEINIPDIHIGKLAWGAETGAPNYDSKEARSLYEEAREGVIQRMSGCKFDEVLYIVGNDMINSDNPSGTTTLGTHVSNDSRYHKTFATVRNLVLESVERLREVAPVRVVLVPGNHDSLSIWHLGDSVECFFRNCPDVSIDNRPLVRKYYQFGKVLLMFTHGDKAKRLDYPLLMAAEEPKMWGDTEFREAHTGHLHKTKVEEQNGVRVRVLPALCPIDAWHSEMGFVGALRQAEAFAWNKYEGLIGTAFYNARNDMSGVQGPEPLPKFSSPGGSNARPMRA